MSTDWTDYFPNKHIPCDTIKFWTFVLNFEIALKTKVFYELAQWILRLLCVPVGNAFVENIFSFILLFAQTIL